MHPAPSCLPLAYIRHYGKRHCIRIYTVYFLFLPAFCEDCLQAGSKRATALADRKRRPEGGCKFLHGNLIGENYLHFVPWTREENRQTEAGGVQGGLLQPSLTNNDNLDNHTTTQPHRPASFRPSICAISTCRCAVPLREIPAFAVVGGGPRVIARAEPLGCQSYQHPQLVKLSCHAKV
ncbi:hypothetical protein CABS01_04990 [Colletotrichum abscissum]|uniref:uncharacterized protein n=1 Tax=Colletotrichum abscissum TaxID=1671311 RepID=UPI0027D536C1|nr:uncharacterized protein CABS01_04990 [Colletotrichum abscissum]KAK1523369.1 hypothetical protein CABS01_04990 [Colletotrichum abscissum]